MEGKNIGSWFTVWGKACEKVLDYTMGFSNFLYAYPINSGTVASFLVYSIFGSFFSFIIVYVFGNNLGSRGSSLLIVFNTAVSLIIVSLYIYVEYWVFIAVSTGLTSNTSMLIDSVFKVPTFTFMIWFALDNFTISWGFLFDPISIFMVWIILFITFVVQVYCLDYMHGDPFVSKFYAYLSIFSFFMLFMVCSPNYLQLFLGWEGVGLASFMLISFWNTRRAAVFSGMKAMFLNRVGDVFFLFATFIIFKEFQTLDFLFLKAVVVDYYGVYYGSYELWYFSIAILIASMAKSAQLGLHMWLPDAMEGPTPVSALIHAATMVTAGIFVLIRSSFMLVCAPSTMLFMCLIGGLTALFGSTVACVQYDIKKIIAYSTCSQLGYMMLGCGSGNFFGAFFHLINHAFFKAMLFLGSGSVIHALNNEQDIRKMGGLVNFLPFTFSIMLLGSMSISGIPFFSGFYSKDDVLEGAYLGGSVFSFIGFILGLTSVFFTAFYSFRLTYYVFFDYYKGSRILAYTIHEPGRFMTSALLFLVFPSLMFGFFFKDLFISSSCSGLWTFAVVQYEFNHFLLSDFVSRLPIIFNFCGILSSYFVYVVFSGHLPFLALNSGVFSYIYIYLLRKWFFDDFLSFFTLRISSVGHIGFWLYFERGFLYYFGPRGISSIFSYLYRSFISTVTNVHFLYLKLVVVSTGVFGFWLIFWPTAFSPIEYVVFFFCTQFLVIVYLLIRRIKDGN